MLRVLAPVTGHARPVRDVPDPVFARGLVGPGVTITPAPGPQTAVAPIAGTLLKLHPHAYLIRGDDGVGVLVHLGIDTVQMRGDGFTLHAREGARVTAGERVVSWDPTYVAAAGRSSACMVVVPDGAPESVWLLAVDTEVTAGQALFDVDPASRARSR